MSTQSENMENFLEQLTTITLIAAALISIIISLGDLFFDFGSIAYVKETSQITLFLVGILCFSLGLERIVNLEQLTQEIRGLRKDIRTAIPAQFINTREEVLKVLKESVKNATSQVNLLIFSFEVEQLYSSEFKAYTDALIATMLAHDNLEYRVVYGSNQLSDKEKQSIKERVEMFEDNGLGKQVRYRHDQVPFGFFLYIVDQKTLIIGFSSLPGETIPKNAIRFTDKPELIESIRRWYEENVWNKATPIKFY